MKTEPTMQEITLRLDERNLAHVLAALALSGIADEMDGASPEACCWWTEDAFKLLIPHDQTALFAKAHAFVKSIRWVAGIGCNKKPTGKLALEASAHHGLFEAEGGHRGNPLLSYHDQGVSPTIFKTFAGQQNPATPLKRQQDARWLKSPLDVYDWLFQRGFGVASWKLDSSIGRHAYDQGFGSNEDQSPDKDPFYPAIELLSMAGAAFFAQPQSWLSDSSSLHCRAWLEPVPLALASLAPIFQIPASVNLAKLRPDELPKTLEDASLLHGLGGRFYTFTRRGNTYGTGEKKYRHFPEASLITQINNQETP